MKRPSAATNSSSATAENSSAVAPDQPQGIHIAINGQPQAIAAGGTVADLLSQQSVRTHLVAVELNMEIVPQHQYASTPLRDGDQVEVVTLVGGG